MGMSENPMKNILLLFLVIAGCMAAGCVGQMKSAADNAPNVTPSNTFTSFSNATPPSNLTNIIQWCRTTGIEGAAENIYRWLDW